MAGLAIAPSLHRKQNIFLGMQHAMLDAIDRAVGTTEQVLQHLVEAELMTGSSNVMMTYDDFDLTISIKYRGSLPSLPNVGIRKRFFLEEESFSYGLADFLAGVYPD